jgi:hypothetical protein
MNGSGQKLFAGSRFALDQDGGIELISSKNRVDAS